MLQTTLEKIELINKLKEQTTFFTTKSVDTKKFANNILEIDSSLTHVAKRLNKAAKHFSICALNCQIAVNKYTKEIAQIGK